jgi:hypothetical protein
MINVGEIFQHTRTHEIFVVIAVTQTHYSYGWNGTWRTKLVPQIEMVECSSGRHISETIPTGNLKDYNYSKWFASQENRVF